MTSSVQTKDTEPKRAVAPVKLKPVRIKSTRTNLVTFPEINKGPDAKAAGLTHFSPQPIAAGTVTVLDGEYWKAMEKNEMVQTFFVPGGGMEVVKGTGDADTGFPLSLLGLSNGAAQTFITECNDKAIIIGWLRDIGDGNIRDAALAKLNVIDGHAARGTSKEGPSPAV